MTKGAAVLIGRTITAVELASDKKAIRFCTDEGDVVARADGDCCSSTWIEHVELPTLPAKVSAVEAVPMPDPEQKDEYDEYVVVSYGFKITTDKGYLDIEYRNESNGYYGGELSWPGDYFYGGVYGQNVSEDPAFASPDTQPRDEGGKR